MNFKRALITGGAGLVGSHIADLLVRDGLDEIVIVDNFTRGRRDNLANALASGTITIVEGDVRDRKLMAEAMRGIDVVFHQAAIRITQCAEDPRLALDVLSTGTFNVLEAAVAARVKKVVAASSASVYGLAEEFPTPETHHGYDNRTIYGAAKLFNEGLLRSFHDMYGLNYVALRYFNVYGPENGYSRRLYGSSDPLDGAACKRRTVFDFRRRNADDGFRVHRRHRSGESVGGKSERHRRSLQCGKRNGNQPERTRCCAGPGYGLLPAAAVWAGAQGESRLAQARRYRQGGALTRIQGACIAGGRTQPAGGMVEPRRVATTYCHYCLNACGNLS